LGSQFWDLNFTQGASHDPGPGIFLAHDFQDMDGEPGDFTVSEGHGHPLVNTIETTDHVVSDWSIIMIRPGGLILVAHPTYFADPPSFGFIWAGAEKKK
jgi:hypothetical protein